MGTKSSPLDAVGLDLLQPSEAGTRNSKSETRPSGTTQPRTGGTPRAKTHRRKKTRKSKSVPTLPLEEVDAETGPKASTAEGSDVEVGPADLESDLAYELVHLRQDGAYQKRVERPVLEQSLKVPVRLGGHYLNLDVGYRAATAGRIARQGRYLLDLRSLSVEWSVGMLRVIAGLQTIRWGESFGLPIVDLVNPVDAAEVWAWNRDDHVIPQGTLLAAMTWGALTHQVLITPEPRCPRPPEGLPQPAPGERCFPWGKEVEGGIRLGYLFGSGLDLKVFALRHHQRAQLVTIDPIFGSMQRHDPQVTSVGMSSSWAFESVVLRADAVRSQDVASPNATNTDLEKMARLEMALGGDYTVESGDATLGIVVHAQSWQRKPEALTHKDQGWIGYHGTMEILDGALSMDATYLGGIQSDDELFVPKIMWEMSDRFSWTLAAELGISKGNGDPQYFRNRTAISNTLAARF